ncbi:YceI family protein [Aeoliella mucimassa]|nr:YceI family protein [Aeoliella mucimassa]
MMRVSSSKLTLAALVCCVAFVVAAGVVELGGLAFADQEPAEETKIVPVAVEGTTAKIGPANTRVDFVGIHTGNDPKPRLGGFKKFQGVLVVEGDALKTISVEFEIGSIWTEFDKLTQHLQAADFFHVEEYPTASFKSTKIEPADKPGMVDVTGVMNMHGTDSEITFPAKVRYSEEGIVLDSEFKLDRTAFGMSDHLDGVAKLVDVHVVVGQATDKVKEAPSEEKATPAETGEAPKSGLAVGQSVEPWTPMHVSGPDKGTRTCPLCTYLARPAIVVFAKDGATTEKLVADVEKLLAKHQSAELKGFVAVLDASPGRLETLATEQGLKRTALCYPDAQTGLKDLAAYQIDPEVNNTVMIYKDYKVVANWVDLDAANLKEFDAAVANMVK